MNRITSAAKLDLMTAKSGQRTVMIAFLIPLVIGFVAKNPSIMMAVAMVLATNVAGTVFSIHEKNNSDKLYGILPLKKSEMIIGRYLFGLSVGAVSIIIASILFLAVSQISHARVNASTFWAVFALSFSYYCFAVGVSYPLYLKFTFAKAYIFTMLPLYVVLIGFIVLVRKTGIAEVLSPSLRFLANNLFLVPIVGIICGLLMLTISALIANLIYTRKEI